MVAVSILALIYLVTSWLSTPSITYTSTLSSKPPMTKAPAGQPNVVLVTVLDDERGEAYNDAIKKNRQSYADKHGTSHRRYAQ